VLTRKARGLLVVAALLVATALLTECGSSASSRRGIATASPGVSVAAATPTTVATPVHGTAQAPSSPGGPALAGLDLTAFRQVAQQAICADRENRMYGIDGKMVYWVRRSSCADASGATTLFGRAPSVVLCSGGQTIAGPRSSRSDHSAEALFQAIDASRPDLGLGSTHAVALFSDLK
jgi:hypothetical protein